MTTDRSLTLVAYLKYYPSIFLKEHTKNLTQDYTVPGRRFKHETCAVRSKVMIIRARCSAADLYSSLSVNHLCVRYFVGRNVIVIGIVNLHDSM